MGWLWWIIIGALAGWGAGYALKRDTKLDVGDILVGIVGGVVGPFLLSFVGLGVENIIGGLIASFIGAIIVTIVWEKYIR